MKNQMFHFISGYVRAEVKGSYTELFLDRCVHNNIPIWMVKRIDDETISCYFFLKDISKIRVLLRRTGCRLSFKQKFGLPFFIKKMYSRKGFVFGLLFSLFVIFFLSNMIWSIQIHGASPEVEHEVKQTLQKIGVKKRAFIFSLPSEQEIQQAVTESVDHLTWIGVKRLGTRYSFEVVEKKMPEEKEALDPRHLVAKKKAVIHKIFAEQGQAIVEERDYVKKGDILISGIVGTDEHEKVVPAKGSILGEVWYLSTATVPLKSTIITNTGNTLNKYYMKVGKITIPIWGFEKDSFSKKETITDRKPIYFLKWQLPISFQKEKILEIEHTERVLTEKQAKEVALEMTKKDLMRQLPNDAEIKGKKILHEKIDNGKVNVAIHYQVIEEVSTEQPIIRGD